MTRTLRTYVVRLLLFSSTARAARVTADSELDGE